MNLKLAIILLFSILHSQSKININDLVELDGKMYKPLSDKLYSGIVYDSYTGTGEKKLEGFYRNGLKNGEWTWWNVFGGIDSTGNFRKGLFYGQWKFYHSNGQLKARGSYRNGDGTNRDEYGLTAHGRHGKWTFWHGNGLQASEITYKEGERVGIWISWNEQGQKVWEGTFDEYQAEKARLAEEEAKLKTEEERRKAEETRLKAEKARLAEEEAKLKTEEERRKAEETRLKAEKARLAAAEKERLVVGQSVTASVDVNQLAVNETFTFKIEAKDAKNMPLINLSLLEKNFTIISGPAQQTSYQWINGKTTSSTTLAWTLVPNKKGKLVIPAMVVVLDGKKMKTKPIPMNVKSSGSVTQKAEEDRLVDQIPDVLIKKGQEMIDNGDLIGAETVLEDALKADPTFAPAMITLSNVYLRKGDMKKTQEYILKAIDADPENQEYRSEFERLNEINTLMVDGQRNMQTGDLSAAYESYRVVLVKFPFFAEAA